MQTAKFAGGKRPRVTDLHAASEEQLKAELQRRERATSLKPPAPRVLQDIDWSVVWKTVVDGVNDTVEKGYQDGDLETYVYEAVIDAVYGKEYWPWRRAQRW